jgi:hypothetical protein
MADSLAAFPVFAHDDFRESCGAQERESTKGSCIRCVAAVACRIPLPLLFRSSQLRSDDSGHFIAFRLYQYLDEFGVVQGVLECKRERLGAQGQGPVPNHWKRSDSSGRGRSNCCAGVPCMDS